MPIVSLIHRLCAFYKAYYITDHDGSSCQTYGGLKEEVLFTFRFWFLEVYSVCKEESFPFPSLENFSLAYTKE